MSYNIPENCRFTEKHEWARQENGLLLVGITDYAQSSLGDIVYVDVKDEGTDLSAGDSFGAIESVKAAEDLYAPVSGTITEINTALKDAPESINKDANSAWLVKLKDYNADEFNSLMDAAAYRELVASLDT